MNFDFLSKEKYKSFRLEEKHFEALNLKWYQVRAEQGFNILYLPKENYQEKYFSFFVPYGAFHAPMGVAHFLEHCLFNEEGDTPFTVELQHLGFQANAYTTYDYTLYFSKGVEWKAGDMAKAISLYAKQIFDAQFDESKVEKERQIILSEWGMQQADKDYLFYQALMHNLHQEHPFKKDILGEKEDILNIQLSDLRAFYQKAYRPNEMTLILVGKIDLEEVLEALLPYVQKTEAYTREVFSFETLPLSESETIPKTKEMLALEEVQGMFYLAGKDVAYHKLYQAYQRGEASLKDLLRHKLRREECFEFFFGDQSYTLHQFYYENLINEHFYFVYNSGISIAQYYFSCPHPKPQEALERFESYLQQLPRESQETEKALFKLLRVGRLGRLLQDTDHLEFMGELLLQSCIHRVDFMDYLELILEVEVDFEEFLEMLSQREHQSALLVLQQEEHQ